MKTIFSAMIMLFAVAFIAPSNLSAQKGSKNDTIVIKSSAECSMCKDRIEKEIGLAKGVKHVSVDLQTKNVTVIYNPTKTTPDKIRLELSKLGYDADDVKANNRAQKKLPDCCQPGGKDSMPK